MDNSFQGDEKLYRAVFATYKKKDGTFSDASLKDAKGLSVERGDYRDDQDVLLNMAGRFKDYLVSLTVNDCWREEAIVKYLPSRESIYHSEIHGSESKLVLSSSQRKHLIDKIQQVGVFQSI